MWMSEKKLRAEIYGRCSELGLFYIHHPDSRRADGRGWPDLTIIGAEEALFRELKSTRGRLRVDQRRVGSMLTRIGYDWAVWRPVHLLDGTVERQLADITGE